MVRECPLPLLLKIRYKNLHKYPNFAKIARHNAPSIMFLDEADAILGARGGSDGGGVGEHEASRRSKAEFLIQLDGMANDRQESDGVWIDAGPVLFCLCTD